MGLDTSDFVQDPQHVTAATLGSKPTLDTSDFVPSGSDRGPAAALVGAIGKHTGIVGTDIDVLHAGNKLTSMIPGQPSAEQMNADAEATAAANPKANMLGSLAGSGASMAVGGGLIGAAVKGVASTVSSAIQAAKAAKVAQQLQAINAAQDAARINKLAQYTEPYDWKTAGARISKVLKDDADATATTPRPGEPPWQTSQTVGSPAQDVTELPTGPAAKGIGDAARQSAITMMKNPWFWATVTGGGKLPLWGLYHAAKVIQHLGTIFGEE